MFVKVQVTSCGEPVSDAEVTFQLPLSFTGTPLLPISDEPGFYGQNDTCWSWPTTADTAVAVQAVLPGEDPVIVSGWTSQNPVTANICP